MITYVSNGIARENLIIIKGVTKKTSSKISCINTPTLYFLLNQYGNAAETRISEQQAVIA
jgi:hypothetical protein